MWKLPNPPHIIRFKITIIPTKEKWPTIILTSKVCRDISPPWYTVASALFFPRRLSMAFIWSVLSGSALLSLIYNDIHIYIHHDICLNWAGTVPKTQKKSAKHTGLRWWHLAPILLGHTFYVSYVNQLSSSWGLGWFMGLVSLSGRDLVMRYGWSRTMD